MPLTAKDKAEIESLVRRLEFNSLNHMNWAWSVDHRDAAAMIRRLAGMPPAPVPSVQKKTTRGKK
jgi:hypothetical protein